MTEADWRATTNVPTLLRWAVPRGTRRQLRLYLCGGCRVIQQHFWRLESMDAVEVAERYSDGQATDEELSRADWLAESPAFDFNFEEYFWRNVHPAAERDAGLRLLITQGALPTDYVWGDEWRMDPVVRDRLFAAADLAFHTTWGFPEDDWERWSLGQVEHWSRNLAPAGWPGRWLVDCIYGNPFRPPAVQPEWRTPTVLAIADGVYTDRAYDRLPVLADALEDAGCDAADLLAHCRGGGPHARGCWVVDRVLDKPDEPATAAPG